MNFLTEKFVFFFLIILILNYCANKKTRVYLLLIASLVFYSSSNIKFLPIVLAISLSSYVFGYLIDTKENRKLLYITSIFIIILPLLYFKYTNFIIDIVKRFLQCQINFFELVAPLGISFLTFQAISYVSDIYYKKMHYEKNIFKVILFILFFPNVSSGPIQRARYFLPQLENDYTFNEIRFKHGCYLIAFGALQKLCVSDMIFPIVNEMTSNFQNYSGFQYLFFAVMYAIYIYSNFNSYSDMAIGVAEILGFNLGENFKRPYLSLSIKEFWQRWHMSLNEWFVDYVYIPLGGSRKGKIRKYINIIVVFFISGLWHGAGVHFIAWGGLNAIYQIVGDMTLSTRATIKRKLCIENDTIGIKTIQRIIVFFLISISWILFAIPSFRLSIYAIKSIFTFKISTIFDGTILNLMGSNFDVIKLLTILFVFGFIQIIREKKSILSFIEKEPKVIRFIINTIIMIILLLAWLMSFQGSGNGGFVYFNF